MFISRELNEMTSERIWESGMDMPQMRFFKPNDRFWQSLETTKQAQSIDMFIDCGTGNGELPEEALAKGFKMAGCDVIRRIGNDRQSIHIMPAHMMPLNEKVWPIVCRPDHSGWARALLQKALYEDGTGFIYVGLPENLNQDLGEDLQKVRPEIFVNVGEDCEAMLVYAPIGG